MSIEKLGYKLEEHSPFRPKAAFLCLFKGEMVFLSSILQQTPYIKPAIKVLIDRGELVGQRIMFGEKEDVLLFMPSKLNPKSRMLKE